MKTNHPAAVLILSIALLVVTSCSQKREVPDAPTKVDDSAYVVTDSGLKYHDLVVGRGPVPQAGMSVRVHYTGWLTDGRMFDSSIPRGEPHAFVLGEGRVIKGWEEGVASMNVGTKRQLVIPAKLGYGPRGAGNVIPPGATLIFEVELVEIR